MSDRLKEIEKELKGMGKLEEIVLFPNPVPEKVKYEDYVLKKANAICKLVKEKYGAMEWYGFLVAREENPQVITDIALGVQKAGSAHVGISEEEIAKVMEELEEELTIVGWIHSHADMHWVEFSGIDERNIRTVASSVSLNTQVVSKFEEIEIDYPALLISKDGKEELFVTQDEELVRGELEKLKDYKISLIVKEERKPGIVLFGERVRKVKLLLPYKVGWSYNLLVNNWGDKNASIAVIEEYGLNKGQRFYEKKIEFDNPIESGREVDYKLLKEEINKKIIPRFPIITWRSILSAFKKEKKKKEERKAKEIKEVEKVEREEIYKPELSKSEIYRFIGKMHLFQEKLEKGQFEKLEERIGVKLLMNERIVEKIGEYAKEDPQIMLLIREINETSTPYYARIVLRRYLR